MCCGACLGKVGGGGAMHVSLFVGRMHPRKCVTYAVSCRRSASGTWVGSRCGRPD
jgi:hypothetical protein